MTKPIHSPNPESKFSQIVREYRANQKMSLRDFATALSERCSGPSYQIVLDWERGIYTPKSATFMPLILVYQDWRRDFATDCTAALMPQGMYIPSGAIGRRVLGYDADGEGVGYIEGRSAEAVK